MAFRKEYFLYDVLDSKYEWLHLSTEMFSNSQKMTWSKLPDRREPFDRTLLVNDVGVSSNFLDPVFSLTFCIGLCLI